VFRGKRHNLVKLLRRSGDGMNLYLKRLERDAEAQVSFRGDATSGLTVPLLWD
jgi:hypothetical protein